MGAELIQDRIELYRFKEFNGTFSGVCVIIYDGDSAWVRGLHGKIDIEDIREIKRHMSKNGVKRYHQIRRGVKVTKKLKAYP